MDVQSNAAWTFLGGNDQNLWMLTDGALQTKCEKENIFTNDREEMMEKLLDKAENTITRDMLPNDLNILSLSELKNYCKHHCIQFTIFSSKNDLIEKILNKDIVGNNDIKHLAWDDMNFETDSNNDDEIYNSDN